jgi:hypothetical protein
MFEVIWIYVYSDIFIMHVTKDRFSISLAAVNHNRRRSGAVVHIPQRCHSNAVTHSEFISAWRMKLWCIDSSFGERYFFRNTVSSSVVNMAMCLLREQEEVIQRRVQNVANYAKCGELRSVTRGWKWLWIGVVVSYLGRTQSDRHKCSRG